MKKYFNFFLFACLLSACQSAKEDGESVNKILRNDQSKEASDSSATLDTQSPKNIMDIQKSFNRLELWRSEGKLDTIKKDFDCEGEASAKAVYFYQGKILRMIRVEYQEHDHYSSDMSFYLSNGKPFFIFRTDYTWTFAEGMAAEGITKENITEKRYYLINNKLAKYLEKKYSYLSNEKKPEAGIIVAKELNAAALPLEIENLKQLLASEPREQGGCLILK